MKLLRMLSVAILLGLLVSPGFAQASIMDINCPAEVGCGLGTAGEFNTFVFGDFSGWNSDTEGRLAAGGNVTLLSYGLGDKLTPGEYEDVLIVGGHLTATNGQANNGNVLVGGTATLTGFNIVGGHLFDKKSPLPIDFAAEEDYLKTLSQELAMLPPTGTAKKIYGGSLKLTGNDNSNSRRQVFYVNGAELLTMYGVSPLEGIPSGATIVVNVSGTSSGLTNMSMAAFDDSVKQKVLFNFYEATELKISGIGVKGSILAPYAHLENPENGHIDGTLIAASVGGNMQGGFLEQHPFAFTGDLPCVEPVLASLGDRVWYDANENGIQDDGEAGANGVTVTLYTSDVNCTSGDVVAETTTDDDGKYLFENLDEGQYYVEFSNLPTGYTFTTLNQGSDDASDSDADRTTGRTVCTSLKPGDNDLTWDAGLVLEPVLASLGDRVWYDANENGIQDDGEAGANGVTVTLYTSDVNCTSGDVVAETTTDDDGKYLFENLDEGQYYVEFSNLPTGYTFTTLNQGSDDASDSDADRTTGRTVCTSLKPGDNDLTWDAGLVLEPVLASLGDRVWYDANENGIQDDGEAGANGVTVTLYSSTDVSCTSGDVVAETTTDDDGKYLFENLDEGEYYVEFSNLPTGYTFTTLNQGSDDASDSDADRTTGRTVCTSLKPGDNDLTWDAGLVLEPVLASLGDRVWYDANENGIQDDGEAGANGVTVTLYSSTDVSCTSGDVVAETTTDDDGKYLFENLDAGQYYVEFSNLPIGYTFTTLNQGSDDASDSDADRTTGRTVCTSLKPGDNDLTWDAGLVMEPGISKYQKVAEPGAVIDPDSGWIQSPLYEIGMEDTLSYKIELEDFEYDGLLGLTIQDTLDENLDYSGGMFVQMLVGTEWKDLQMSDYQFQSDNDTLRWSSFSESVLETADSFRFLFNASVTSDDFDAIDNTAEFTLDGEEPFTDSNIVVAYPVPEPGTILFLSVGLFGLFAVGRRRLKK